MGRWFLKGLGVGIVIGIIFVVIIELTSVPPPLRLTPEMIIKEELSKAYSIPGVPFASDYSIPFEEGLVYSSSIFTSTAPNAQIMFICDTSINGCNVEGTDLKVTADFKTNIKAYCTQDATSCYIGIGTYAELPIQ